MKQKTARIALCCLSLCTAIAHGMETTTTQYDIKPQTKQKSRQQRRRERQKNVDRTTQKQEQSAPRPENITSFVDYEQEILPSLRNLLETTNSTSHIFSLLPFPDSYAKRQLFAQHTAHIRALEQHIVTLSNHRTHHTPGKNPRELPMLHDAIHQLSTDIGVTTKKLSALACSAIIDDYVFRPKK